MEGQRSGSSPKCTNLQDADPPQRECAAGALDRWTEWISLLVGPKACRAWSLRPQVLLTAQLLCVVSLPMLSLWGGSVPSKMPAAHSRGPGVSASGPASQSVHSGSQRWMAQVLGSLPSTTETQMKSWAPGFHLVHLQPLWAFGE